MQNLKKAAGTALIYAGFLGDAFAACAADCMDSFTLIGVVVGSGILLLAGLVLRGDEE